MISTGKNRSDKHKTQNSEHCSRNSLVEKNTSHVLLILPLKIYCHYLENIKPSFQVHGSVHRCNNLNKNANQMYFVLKSLKFIYIIPLYMFQTTLCLSSGASQLHMQSLVPINYKNTCCLRICPYVHFIITANYLCGTNKPFFNLYVCFVLFCF